MNGVSEKWEKRFYSGETLFTSCGRLPADCGKTFAKHVSLAAYSAGNSRSGTWLALRCRGTSVPTFGTVRRSGSPTARESSSRAESSPTPRSEHRLRSRVRPRRRRRPTPAPRTRRGTRAGPRRAHGDARGRATRSSSARSSPAAGRTSSMLYDAYFPRVFRFALKRLHDAGEAEDVTQEVFVTVFRRLHTWPGDSSLLVWIFGITRNKVNRRFRAPAPPPGVDRQRRRLEIAGRTGRDRPDRRRAPHARPVRVGDRAPLTPLQRRIFHLKHLRRQSIRSIAGTLGQVRGRDQGQPLPHAPRPRGRRAGPGTAPQGVTVRRSGPRAAARGPRRARPDPSHAPQGIPRAKTAVPVDTGRLARPLPEWRPAPPFREEERCEEHR